MGRVDETVRKFAVRGEGLGSGSAIGRICARCDKAKAVICYAPVRRRRSRAALLHASVYCRRAFRTLKGDLCPPPVFHQRTHRIEAHLSITFLACRLSIILRQKLRTVAGGLMSRLVWRNLPPHNCSM